MSMLRNMSLKKKLLICFFLIGCIPLLVALLFSYRLLYHNALENQRYAASQSYLQAQSILEEKFRLVENASLLIAVNSSANNLLRSLYNSPTGSSAELRMAQLSEIPTNIYAVESSNDITDIVFYLPNVFMGMGTDRYRSYEMFLRQPEAQRLLANNGRITWLLLQDERDQRPALSITRNIVDFENYARSLATLRLDMDYDKVQSILAASASSPYHLVMLTDALGQPWVTAGDGSAALPAPGSLTPSKAFVEIELEGVSYLYRSERFLSAPLYLTSMIPTASLLEGFARASAPIILVYFLLGLAVVLIIFPVASSITRRIVILNDKMKAVQSGDMTPLVLPSSRDEVGTLVESFNYMVLSMQTLLREQYVLGREKENAELRALQSQINPHFLYNTLDMLHWMNASGETKNVDRVINSMSDYYKRVLAKGRDIIPLQDEISLCAAYMEIQQMRFKGRIQYLTDIEASLLPCLLPKITLQPLIENAIVHGLLEKANGRGKIIVSAWEENGEMVLTVTDDGVGAPPEPVKASKGSVYGLANIEQRLCLLYGKTQCMTFESTPGIGTCVILRIPMRYADAEQGAAAP